MNLPRFARLILVASLASGAVLGLGACGSGDTTSTARDASAPGTSCSEQKSLETHMAFVNDLDTKISLDVPRSSWSCDGWSGVSTPGVFDGAAVGPSGRYERRLEVARGFEGDALIRRTAFTLKIHAANSVIATMQVARFQWGRGGRQAYGLEIDGEWWCGKAVEFHDAGGKPAWARFTTCNPNDTAELQFTNVKPESTTPQSSRAPS